LISWPAQGDTPRPGTLLVRVDSASAQEASVVRLAPDAAGVLALSTKSSARVVAFPLARDRSVDLDLQSFELLSPDARLVAVGTDGERELARPKFHAFRGSVRGDPESRVILSLHEGRIAGSIRTGGAEYVVGPRKRNDDGSPSLAVWLAVDDPDRPDGPPCEGDVHVPNRTAESAALPAAPPVEAAIDSGTLLEASVAIDATYEWYTHFGSIEAAQGYILSLMAEVSTIYEQEVGVAIEVPYLRVFTTASDPYLGGTNTSALLGELRAEWNANQSGIQRTVAHLFSTRPSGGAGIAYLDVLCNNDVWPGSSYDYGVSTLSANGGSWEKRLVAHELGHNFSSPHTHCYVPEIDQCATASGCYSGPVNPSVGTIMSYCNSSTPVFHPRVESRIRPAAEAAYPSCIGEAAVTGAPPAPTDLRRTDTID
jgi:hypothetical protein